MRSTWRKSSSRETSCEVLGLYLERRRAKPGPCVGLMGAPDTALRLCWQVSRQIKRSFPPPSQFDFVRSRAAMNPRCTMYTIVNTPTKVSPQSLYMAHRAAPTVEYG